MSFAPHPRLAAAVVLVLTVGCGISAPSDPGKSPDAPPAARAATPGAGAGGAPGGAPPAGDGSPLRGASGVRGGPAPTAPPRTPSTLDILLASVAYPGPSPEVPLAPAPASPAAEAGAAAPAATGPVAVAAAPTSSAPRPSGVGGPNAATRAAQARGPAATPVPTRTRAPTAPPAPTEDRSVLGALRRGELVVYLRHGQTDWTQNDRELAWVKEMLADPGLLDDCDRQRLLSDAGRDDARAIGETVRRLGIPVGRVVASPWCRTRETAELAFGGAEVARGKLFDTGYLASGSDEWQRYIDALRGMLGERPGGGNTVIVGHMPPLRDAAGVTLAESEAAIFRPAGGDFDFLARTGPGGWERLP